ncbi:MAG: hypothetical protein H8E15_00655, partial [Planctomycetes bacterium]|nr:hypothetical protein [Planctomycetota bacterium]
MISALLLTTLALPAQQPDVAQLPEGVVATWDGGKIETVQFERFLGRTNKNKELGMEALRHVVQIQLVELEAERRGLKVPPDLIQNRFDKVEKAAEAACYVLSALLRHCIFDNQSFRKFVVASFPLCMLARL